MIFILARGSVFYRPDQSGAQLSNAASLERLGCKNSARSNDARTVSLVSVFFVWSSPNIASLSKTYPRNHNGCASTAFFADLSASTIVSPDISIVAFFAYNACVGPRPSYS